MTSGPCAPHHCGQHFNVDNTVVVSKLFSGIGSPFQIWKIWICSCQLTFKISLVGREECFVHRTWFWGNSFIFLTLVLVLSRTLQLVWLLHGSLFPTSFAVIPFGNGFMLSLQTPIFFRIAQIILMGWLMTLSPFFKLLEKQLMLIVES